ncbi:AAA family ATPase [Ornithinimicrobium sediminis]|uniref:AAA family ATPase n=1 Tax=Ornithinimicrobium sediminis TaxID=2904603 RepID=UPI001E544662|nr:AAA family ATPase [Ornithinimicrobium sediminis]MCE0485732.1 AAA family ATPase [Ornithinimicrobium sediminis]
MRIHRLTLRHVKGISERTVVLPDDGVVVIEGPNEVGKSTLLEALDRLLDSRCKATSRSQAVRDLQPVGVDAGPFVEAELTVGPYRVVFAKQWLRQTATTLRVLSPVSEQLAGEQAQARMAQILEECLDRPLFDALRFAQGTEVTQIPLADSSVLAEALDGAAGADLHTERGADLLSTVEKEFLTYFTPTGRPTGDLRAAVVEVTAAQDAAVHAHQLLQEAHRLIADRESARAMVQELDARTGEVEAAVGRARGRVEAAAEAAEQDERAVAAERAARQVAERAVADLDARARLADDVARRRTAADELEAELGAAREPVGAHSRHFADTEAERARAEQALDSAQAVAERALGDHDHLADRAELADLRDRSESARTLETQLAAAERALAGQTVTAAVLRTVVAAAQESEVAAAAVQASASTMTVEALADGQVIEVDGMAQTLGTGDAPLDRVVSRDTDVVVPGAVHVRIRPQAGVVARADRWERAQEALCAALEGAGVPDVATAHEAAQRHESAVTQVQRLRTALAATLEGSSVASLTERLGARADAVAAYLEERGDDEGLPADVEQARAVQRAARREVRAAQDAVRGATRAREQAGEALDRARRHLEVTESRLSGCRSELADRVTQLEQTRAQVCDRVLADEATQARTLHEESLRDLADARQTLAETDPTAARRDLEVAHEALQAHRRRSHEARDRLNQLKGRVEMVTGEGRAEAHELAVQAFEDARARLLSLDRRARAARQLHRTLQRHREQAHETYVRPFAAALERLGRQVYGETFEVTVSRDLVITHRGLHGTTVPFESLSGGAKEQLGILARLAVAALVDSEHGVPVVIDDALGYTDPQRLRRVGEVLGAPGASSQVILLTCTPARYDDIPGATTISLTA